MVQEWMFVVPPSGGGAVPPPEGGTTNPGPTVLHGCPLRRMKQGPLCAPRLFDRSPAHDPSFPRPETPAIPQLRAARRRRPRPPPPGRPGGPRLRCLAGCAPDPGRPGMGEEEISDGLRQAQVVVALLSPHSVRLAP